MPLCSNPDCGRERHPLARIEAGTPLPRPGKPSSRCLAIGLVNNMPDTAIEATERQFRSLLASASDGIDVRLSLYALPDVPRTEAGKRHIANHYSNLDQLCNTHLDGLIVTGAEPKMASLKDEPYWDSFTRVLAWARDHTHSTVFSCLAAHAAILHMDGIGRVRNGEKHFGVFDCARTADHRILAGAPSRFQVPHSRWNGIPDDELAAKGYSVLTRTADAGVDLFVKRNKALFVFFQGHPEYESDTLLREYRRDIGRYLKGESETYPAPPRSYFDNDTLRELDALREQAIAGPGESLQANLSSVLEKPAIHSSWTSTAACIYRNWLQYIHEQKHQRESAAHRSPQHAHDAAAVPASASMLSDRRFSAFEATAPLAVGNSCSIE